MNLSLYTAIDRVGLGLAVTLEFLGPLSVALAGSRRRRGPPLCADRRGGVVVLMRPRPSTDYPGIGLGLLAAACWASYILLNRTVGRRTARRRRVRRRRPRCPALMYLPVGIVVAGRGTRRRRTALAARWRPGCSRRRCRSWPTCSRCAGCRPSLRAVHERQPGPRRRVGWIGLGQRLGWAEWAGIGAVVAANALSMVATRAASAPAVASPGGRVIHYL